MITPSHAVRKPRARCSLCGVLVVAVWNDGRCLSCVVSEPLLFPLSDDEADERLVAVLGA